MRIPPLAVGTAAGLIAALLLAPSTGTALGELAKARAEWASLNAAAGRPQVAPPLLVAPALTAEPRALVARIRDSAKSGGVLVEQAEPMKGQGSLLAIRLRLSGPEKSVIALADSLERGAPLIRLRDWRLTALPDRGVRLTAEAVAVRR